MQRDHKPGNAKKRKRDVSANQAGGQAGMKRSNTPGGNPVKTKTLKCFKVPANPGTTQAAVGGENMGKKKNKNKNKHKVGSAQAPETVLTSDTNVKPGARSGTVLGSHSISHSRSTILNSTGTGEKISR
jgi:hypothetical protein